MKERPLTEPEFKSLITRNTTRNDTFSVVRLLQLKLALLAGLREIEIAILTVQTLISSTGELL